MSQGDPMVIVRLASLNEGGFASGASLRGAKRHAVRVEDQRSHRVPRHWRTGHFGHSVVLASLGRRFAGLIENMEFRSLTRT